MGKIEELLNDPEQINKIARYAFDGVDIDRSGYVGQSELENLMNSIAIQGGIQAPSKTEVQQTMQVLDQNHDGRISFEEFKVLIVEMLKSLAGKQI